VGTPGYGSDCSGGEPTAVEIIEYGAAPYVDHACEEGGWAKKAELG